jgi:hypothetical protein
MDINISCRIGKWRPIEKALLLPTVNEKETDQRMPFALNYANLTGSVSSNMHFSEVSLVLKMNMSE